ncbi:MAG: GAF domain-containing protein, partial [Acetobacteraceae bacterium]
RAVLDVLAAVLPPAFFSDENFVCLVLCRMAIYGLAHGNGNASPLGYAYLGMMLGPYFGDWRAGFEFGLLGQALVEEGGLAQYAARVQMCFAYHVAPWTRHISFTLPRLRRAFEVAVRAGDLTYSGFSACTLITSLLAAGVPLAEVEGVAVEKLAFVRRARFGLIVDIITSQLCMIRGLRGYRPDRSEAEGGAWDEAKFEARLQSEPSLAIAACWHWIRKLQAAVIRGAYAEALDSAARAEPLLWTSFGHLEMAEYHFHAGLAHAACCGGADDAGHRTAIAGHREQLRLWAENCPENFAARAALLEGAVAAIEGRGFTAMQHFEAAIRSAAENSLVQVEALAHEWASRFYRENGFATSAGAYLRNARDCYLRWGATTKVQQLEQQDRGLAEQLPLPGAGAEGGLGMIDLASMIRTSQAVSGESGLTALIQTLMQVVLEHAGAERGLLLMPRANELRLEAEAATGPGGITVRLPQRIVTETELPIGLVRHVLRVPETVLIDDAARPGRFAEDGYLARTGGRSVLCIPLLRQLRLTGLLYLENSLAPYVFTPARVTVLQLLASQAAISLENATLEEKEALVREMHHRVKNNLQLVSSLLNLQAARVEDPAVAELFIDSRDRVRSMALVHENLYRAGDYARVPMRHHVETLCAQIERAYRGREGRIRLDVSVEPIQLDLDRAISSGLIINELLSNAFKHAFPDDAAGRISITVSQQGGDCVLTVRDDGIGMPAALAADLDASASLGLQLVGDLVQQLHGRLTLGPPPGAEFTVTFPLPSDGGA